VFKVYQEEGDLILTLPGVYHGGFSPTCNICEAVNMAAVDWIPAALHQKEMNAKEGYPRKSCFSLEWMIYESYLQRDRLNFTPDAIQTLTAHFRSMAEKEIAARNKVRGDMAEEILIVDKKIKFFEIQCFHCRHYTFLSWVGCRYCLRISCLNEPVCGCSDPSRVLFLRCTDSELVNY
jgi:hypothetical protein